MDNFLLRVVADLQAKYKPEIVILYGSRARGDNTPKSDIDVACFTESTKPIKDARDFEGLYLDAWVYSSKTMSAANDELLRLADGYCLYDLEGKGAAFLQELQQRISQGTKQLSTADIEHTKQWIEKMFDRAQNSDIESLYRRYWLAIDLLQIYFNLRGQWYFGPKKSLSWLKENNSVGYDLFSQVYSHEINLSDLSELVEYVTNT
jgi:predicted nucleotidyltransferase